MRNSQTVFTDKTGNGDSSEVSHRKLRMMGADRVAAKLVTTIGATPTVTAKLLGYRGVTGAWITLATAVITTATTTYMHADPALPPCRKYKVNLSANTNVTVTFGYIGTGQVEN